MSARPQQARASIALAEADCTSCNLCVTECPTWCITLTSHLEAAPGPGRARKVKVLDEFEIDYGLCMFCGICVEVCPFDALVWVPTPVLPVDRGKGGAASLVEDIGALAARLPKALGAGNGRG